MTRKPRKTTRLTGKSGTTGKVESGSGGNKVIKATATTVGKAKTVVGKKTATQTTGGKGKGYVRDAGPKVVEQGGKIGGATIKDVINKGPKTPGKLSASQTADIARFKGDLGKLTAVRYAPRLTLPPKTFTLPKGAFVERKTLLPQGVVSAKASFDALREDIPVLLFPVRLETRFTANQSQLRIRIFPDQASINGLDPRLTPEEFNAGTAFLRDHDRAGKEADKRAAWHVFATAYAPRRAAWIVRVIRAGGADKTLRDPDSNHQAEAPLLPDNWLVTGYADGRVAFDKASAAVARDIRFSPDFAGAAQVRGDVAVDPSVKWMVDYTEALRKGMAVTVSVPSWARTRIDELYVLGVRTREPGAKAGALTPQTAAGKLNDLFEAHLYDWGAEFAPTGTATNNTSDVASGYSDRGIDLDEVYSRLIAEGPKTPAAANAALPPSVDETLSPTGALDVADTPGMTQYDRMQTALGLPLASALKKFGNRTGSEDAVQAAMNTLLWPVTIGEMLGQLLKGRTASFFDKGDIDWVRDWFIASVRGGPNLPTLQLGRTPYGVLPVQKTHLQKEPANRTGETLKRQMLGSRLRQLLPFWEAGSGDIVRMQMSGAGSEQAGDRLLHILQRQPYPARYDMSVAGSERSLFDLRYEIRNMIIHPDHDLQLLRDIFADVDVDIRYFGVRIRQTIPAPGKASYYDWPGKFRDGDHQIEVLSGKKQLLLDLLNENSPVYSNLPPQLAAMSPPPRSALAATMLPRRDDIEKAAGYLQEMIDICVDHRDANAQFEAAFRPPSEILNGIVGPSGNDGHGTFLAYGDLRTWPQDAHVVAPDPAAPVSFARQVDYLIGYAQSFISAADPPPEPVFPGGRKPLLYRLLRSAVFRTGVDEEAAARPIFEAAEIAGTLEITPADRQTHIGTMIGAMDVGGITAMTRSVQAVRKASPGKSIAARDEAVARVLRSASGKTLTDIATGIDKEVNARRNDGKFPAREMKALSAELKTLGKAGMGKLRFTATPSTRRARITQMKDALRLLRDLNPQQIELLMSQTMGLASWRLDAWLTSLPARQIMDGRAGKNRHGIQIGAFGWVQDLKPNNRDLGDGNRVKSQGYIHTPSLNHAKTAAVLRAGWTNYGSDAPDSPMAVDLSSNRMRDAGWMFDAVRRGQDMGDMLGHRFERFLKDKLRGAHWIYPIRQAVLELTGAAIDPEQPGVDGLELNRLMTTGKSDALKTKATEVLKTLGGADKVKTWAAADKALAHLSAQIDALADAAIGDSVHALVQGNMQRSGASLSAISDGEVPPPELDFLRTTPTAQTQTHRVGLLAPQQGATGRDWGERAQGYPAALADPGVEELAAALIGPPDQLAATVRYVDKGGKAMAEARFDWKQMLDTRSPFAAPAFQTLMLLPADGVGAGSDLAKRFVAHAAAFPPRDAPKGCTPVFAPTQAEQAALADLMDRWLGWRAVLMDARPLAPRDIDSGEGDSGVMVHLSDLETRAHAALDMFNGTASRLLKALPEPQDGVDAPKGRMRADVLMRLFDDLVRLGVTGAVFLAPTGEIDEDAIWAHAWAIAPKLKTHLRAARAAQAGKGATDEQRLKAAQAVLRAIFGAKFPASVQLATPGLQQLEGSFAATAKRQSRTRGGTPVEWIEKQGYVRPALRALNDAMLIQDCQIGAPGGVSLSVAQWPEDKLHPWIAVDAPGGEDAPRTSLVMGLVPGAKFEQSKFVSGLIVDEIVDRVPAKVANTGAALHFDAPNTEAPQTLLLAVPPDGESWSYATMIDTVRDAFHLARIRGVDGPMMNSVNQVFPSIFADRSTITGATE